MSNSDDVSNAITWFWGSRASQSGGIAHSQGGSGRDAVVGGQHLNAVRDLIVDELVKLGTPRAAIHTSGRSKTMPGYFRPTKNWDLAVTNKDGDVVALFELQSQVGSFGNNANNRAEESIGNPTDLMYAVEHGLIPIRPWTAYIYVIQDVKGSTTRSSNRSSTAYPVDEAFSFASYVDRVTLLAERLVAVGLYNAAWIVATTMPLSESDNATWSSPSEKVGWEAFLSALGEFVSYHFDSGPGPGPGFEFLS